MQPGLLPGATIIVCKFFHLSVGDVVVLFDPRTKKTIVKRIERVKESTYFVVGDNKNESTDSRTFGWIDRKMVVGKVIYPKKV